MLKNKIRYLLQKMLGFDNYLFIFSLFTIKRLSMNRHEREFVHFLELLPTDGQLLDIGANIGIMTVPLAQKAKHGKVYSFEPMPQNVKALKRVVSYHNLENVQVYDHALGSEDGELHMVMPVIGNAKMQGLSHVIDEEIKEQGDAFMVPVKKLDDVAELKDAAHIDGIKIDVENFEYEVLLGAKKLLKKHKPLIYCELWNNEKKERTLNFLRNEIGYTIKIFDGRKLVPYNNQQGELNYFIVP